MAWRSACAASRALAAILGDLAGLGDVVDHHEVLARGGDDVEPGDLHGGRGPGLVDEAALVVEHGADAAVAVAADEHVADLEGPLLDQHAGHHAPALRQRGLQAGPGRRPGRIGREFVQLGDRLQGRQQVGDALAGRRRGLHDLDVAAPLDRVQALLRQLAVDLVDVRGRVDVGHVDLVERHDDRHLGRLGVRDGLDRLGHHAVVGGDDQHDDVRDVGPAGPHGGERLVAGRVDERDLAALGLDLVGADVLGDAAALRIHHVGLADAVQQRGLAVVDMAEDGDHRRPGPQVLGHALGIVDVVEILLGRALVHHAELDAELHGQHDGHLLVEGGVDVDHLVEVHQLAEQVGGLHADGLGQGADGDGRLDLGLRLACGSQGGAMGAAVLAGAPGPPRLLLVGEQDGGGDGRCDSAIDGPLAPAGAPAGAIGGRAESAAGLLAFVFLLDRRQRPGRGQSRPGPGAPHRGAARRRAGRGGRPLWAPPRGAWPPRPPGADRGPTSVAWSALKPPDLISAIISSRVIDFWGRCASGAWGDGPERAGPLGR